MAVISGYSRGVVEQISGLWRESAPGAVLLEDCRSKSRSSFSHIFKVHQLPVEFSLPTLMVLQISVLLGCTNSHALSPNHLLNPFRPVRSVS
jgi:hypothetical protein